MTMLEGDKTVVASEILEFDLELILNYAATETDGQLKTKKPKAKSEQKDEWFAVIERYVSSRCVSPVTLSRAALSGHLNRGIKSDQPGIFTFSTDTFDIKAGTTNPTVLVLQSRQKSVLKKGTFVSLNFTEEAERSLIFNELRFITNRLKKCKAHFDIPKMQLDIVLDTGTRSVEVDLSYKVVLEPLFYRYFSSDVSSQLISILRPHLTPYPTNPDPFFSSYESMPADAHLFYKVITDNTNRLPKVSDSMVHSQLLTELLPFQRKTVKWLLEKESMVYDDVTKTARYQPLLDEDLVSSLLLYPEVDHEQLDKSIEPVLNKLCYGWNRALYKEDICWVNELTGNIFTRDTAVSFLLENYKELNQEPIPARGLLSEEMGLGKTVEIIDLILLNPRPSDEVGKEIRLQLQKEGDIRTLVKAKTTLITAPQTIIHQWYNEISRFSPGLLVTIYRGLGKYPELANIPSYIGEYLRRFDIVLLNYANMSSEADYANYTSRHMTTRGGKKRTKNEVSVEDEGQTRSTVIADSFKAEFEFFDNSQTQADFVLNQKRYEKAVLEEMAAKVRRQDLSKIPHTAYYESPLMLSQWWRVIMDEVQMVSSVASNAFNTASLIPRFHSWGVSGTPARLVAVLQFLRFPPFNYDISKYCWKKVTQYPESNVDFVKVWLTLALRHTKAMVDDDIKLPPQRRILLTVPFTKVEQDKYNQMFESCLASIGIHLDKDQKPSRIEFSQSDCVHLRSWLVKLRQLCGNLQIGNLPNFKGRKGKLLLQGLPEMKTLQSVLDDMMNSVLSEINEGERAVVSRLLDIAQLLEFVLLPEKVIEILDGALEETLRLMFRIDGRLLKEVAKLNGLRSFLKKRDLLSRKQLATGSDSEDEDSYDDQEEVAKKVKEEDKSESTETEVNEAMGKFNSLKESTSADRIKLRSLKLLQHKCYFLLASAHFQLYDEEYQKKIAEKKVEFDTLSTLESNIIGTKILNTDEIYSLQHVSGADDDVRFQSPNYLRDFKPLETLSLEEQKIEQHRYLELKYYELAEQCRKDILRHSIKDVHNVTNKRILNKPSMDKTKFVNDGQSIFPKTSRKLIKGLPKIDINELRQLVGTAKVKQTMFQFENLIVELNKQASVISDFVEQLVQVLCNPLLSDEKSPDGEEYEKSLEDQDRASCLLVVISQLLMDRSNAILERKTRSTEVLKKQEKDLREESRRVTDKAFLKVLQKNRAECKPKSDLSFEELLQDVRLLEHEYKTTNNMQEESFHEVAEILRTIFDNEKNCEELLQKEMSTCYNAVFNARVEYFKQLQQISDSVQGKTYCTEQDNLQAPKINSEVASHLMLFTAAQRKLTRAVSRFRYLSTLIPQEQQSLKSEEKDSYENDCIICQSQIIVGSLTPCGHKFCKACLEEWLKTRSNCPVCKSYTIRDTVHHFTHYESDLKAQAVENGTHVPAHPKDSPDTSAVHQVYRQLDDETLTKISNMKLENSYGSKVDLIVKQVLYLRSQDPDTQIVVFSQWQDLLVILAFAFDMAGITYVSAKGSHVAQYKSRKEDPVEEFKRKDDIKTCFLLNAQAQASGLTLINATHIFLCEPLVNTPVELQAISRIHRIGQTKITTVWMFGIENSVEENIVALGTRNRLEYLKANAREVQKHKRKRRKIENSESRTDLDRDAEGPLADDALKTAESYALSLGLTSEKSTGRVFSGISESVSDMDLPQVYFGNFATTKLADHSHSH
uniref:RING-type domain-containing protein n=1 Tax=Candidozyma auris TaxID=498019 RepID=A0A0L0NRG2_CANAR